ncbi:hypothetical protein ACOTHJ_12850 [Achromobacter xylosoxidans]|uniref:hypothetical protein n=1 Tax=Achromobacter anxifer TaxID=1287737 RepID=UPI00155BE94E|nr:hypothetical protein [Achromobacter anxifer]CAB5514585.1 hypothetical protein LMG26857_03644 [Achromobacter anxifer]
MAVPITDTIHPEFQAQVTAWLVHCFGPEVLQDVQERSDRFLEEGIELYQALGGNRANAHELVDYVFGRPVGEPQLEVGGVALTLAGLCTAAGIQLSDAAQAELSRVSAPELVARVRAKRAARLRDSPLPGSAP